MFQTNHMMSRIVGKGASTVAVEHARCLSTERAFDLTLLPPAFDDHAWLLSSLEASAQKEFFFKTDLLRSSQHGYTTWGNNI